jgi:hypothetical protein
MNIGLLIASFIMFLFASRLFYEAWFMPNKYVKRLDDQRKLLKMIFGFSYWKTGHINIYLVRLVTIIALIQSIVGIFAALSH